MANLRVIAIEADLDLPKHVRIKFRQSSHPVAEMLSSSLPPRVLFDGSSKLQLTLKEQHAEPTYEKMLNASECALGGFDFTEFFARDSAERGRVLISRFQEAVEYVGNMLALSPAPLEEACRKVEDCNFRMRQEIAKLRKRWRGNVVRVFRQIDLDLGERWTIEVENGAQGYVEELRERGASDLRGLYSRAMVTEDGVYRLFDDVARVTFQFQIRPT